MSVWEPEEIQTLLYERKSVSLSEDLGDSPSVEEFYCDDNLYFWEDERAGEVSV